MIRQSVKSFLTGAARGALTGGLVGAGILFFGVAAATLILAGTLNPFAIAGAFMMGGISVFTAAPLNAVLIGGCAAIGACYKGISDFVDMEETLQQKEEMVEAAHTRNALAKAEVSKSVRPHHEFVPEQVPNVAQDEMPKEWAKTVQHRRADSAQQTEKTL